MINESHYQSTTKSENEMPKNLDMCVRIEQARNGVIVEAYSKTGPVAEKQYVFNSLEEALQEIPSIMSVAKAEMNDKKKEGQVLSDEE